MRWYQGSCPGKGVLGRASVTSTECRPDARWTTCARPWAAGDPKGRRDEPRSRAGGGPGPGTLAPAGPAERIDVSDRPPARRGDGRERLCSSSPQRVSRPGPGLRVADSGVTGPAPARLRWHDRGFASSEVSVRSGSPRGAVADAAPAVVTAGLRGHRQRRHVLPAPWIGPRLCHAHDQAWANARRTGEVLAGFLARAGRCPGSAAARPPAATCRRPTRKAGLCVVDSRIWCEQGRRPGRTSYWAARFRQPRMAGW